MLNKTNIICTLGPASDKAHQITALREAGMIIARLNLSHGNLGYHSKIIEEIDKSFKDNPEAGKGRPLAIALDTTGSEIRLGDLKDGGSCLIKCGDMVILSTDHCCREDGDPMTGIYVHCSKFGELIRKDQNIYIDDGMLILQVINIDDESAQHDCWKVECVAKNEYLLRGRKGVNLPDSQQGPYSLTAKDLKDIEFAVEKGVDFIFVSFTRHPDDILNVRNALGPKGSNIQVIAKIENQAGIDNFDAILAEADGILIERGDLGIEIPIEKVCPVQKQFIEKCRLVGKPVICATQMLESMTVNPRPTRAEAADVANAVIDGTDCVMLSGETAIGKYPLQTVLMMSLICTEAEAFHHTINVNGGILENIKPNEDIYETMARSIVLASKHPKVKAIMCLSATGRTPKLISKYQPHVSIIVITRNRGTARQLSLYRGCFALIYPRPMYPDWNQDVLERFQWSITFLKSQANIHKGDRIIIVHGSKPGQGHSDTMKIIEVE